MNRRDCLKVAGASLLAASGLGLYLRYMRGSRQQTETDIFVENFPLQIDGAAAVVKTIYENSQYCLVHVLQIHGMHSAF